MTKNIEKQIDEIILLYQTQTALDIFGNDSKTEIPREILIKLGPMLYDIQKLLKGEQ